MIGILIVSCLSVLRLGPLVVGIAILLYYIFCAMSDFASLSNLGRVCIPKNEEEYYLRLEPRPKKSYMLSAMSLLLCIAGWWAAIQFSLGDLPRPIFLVGEIVFTVVGMTICYYARQKSCTFLQTAVTWIPMVCWLLQAAIMLSPPIEKVQGANPSNFSVIPVVDWLR